MKARLITAWGVFGVALVLLQAVVRLFPMAAEPWTHATMTTSQAALYVGWVLFNAYAEGYRAFQKRFCPRVVGRALYLARNPRPLHVTLAPFFCMNLLHARKRSLIVAWTFVTVLVGVVWAVRQLPQPWRGIVDGGVVVGLVWGVLTLVVLYARAMRGQPPTTHLHLPEDARAPQ